MYLIVNPRIGTPGDPFEPAEGINIDALLKAGFIVAADGEPRGKNKTKASAVADTNQE